MANTEYLVPVEGPSGAGLLRLVFIEQGSASGIFRLTFETASLDAATYPSLAASITAATNRVDGADKLFSSSASATPTVQPSATNNGTVFIGTLGSGNQTYTLPSAATGGLSFTFIAGSAAGELLVNPNGTDTISIKATVDQGANVTTAAGVGIKNTAATNVLGDFVTLISDGVSKWWMIGQSGIWASQ
jgi:hypothetical protein